VAAGPHTLVPSPTTRRARRRLPWIERKRGAGELPLLPRRAVASALGGEGAAARHRLRLCSCLRTWLQLLEPLPHPPSDSQPWPVGEGSVTVAPCRGRREEADGGKCQRLLQPRIHLRCGPCSPGPPLLVRLNLALAVVCRGGERKSVGCHELLRPPWRSSTPRRSSELGRWRFCRRRRSSRHPWPPLAPSTGGSHEEGAVADASRGGCEVELLCAAPPSLRGRIGRGRRGAGECEGRWGGREKEKSMMRGS
jgi:hypothetical protein